MSKASSSSAPTGPGANNRLMLTIVGVVVGLVVAAVTYLILTLPAARTQPEPTVVTSVSATAS